ncbi:tetraacyldisaccharide 4'-kinase [Pedobacter aquae]|uniref:Tetraacyldisaccharide 4'-kinase n=1 Tax=Pedobacter aquae TaxID=2605747 RepID=A0A5C0VL08_9SPHI|nr:tetraacyldisaccharide 4'-kinase [Pedobacter aquae]QEK51860.1 tetraacyldisaccharide 4'-kinase [Pedobacter aquae]
MAIFRLLLFPFSLIYGIIVWLRNKFYDWNWFNSTSFKLPLIVIGNLEVGGVGKTPLTEYIIRLLKSDFKMATLSRGYGRKTKGFRLVEANQDASLNGDEPQQLKNKFPEITVAVCEDRVLGVEKLKETHELIVLDDAYQHRALKAEMNLLLFDYHRLKHLKLLLPAGNYRESFAGKSRARIIIITKCPIDLSEIEKRNIKESFSLASYQKIFFSSLAYSKQLRRIATGEGLALEEIATGTPILLLTGIARPALLRKEVEKYSTHIIHHNYPDHHHFSRKNMLKLVADFKKCGKGAFIITTEKDAVRLKSQADKELLAQLPIYEWPIEVVFKHDELTFKEEIIRYVKAVK